MDVLLVGFYHDHREVLVWKFRDDLVNDESHNFDLKGSDLGALGFFI